MTSESAQPPAVRPLRLAAEGLAIIVSILLAFSIDAWWESRKEHAAEAAAVQGLRDEFEENLRQLRIERDSHADSLRATQQLLELVGPDSDPTLNVTTIAPLLISCLTNANFEPRLGTLNSLIAAGRLQLIEDATLRSMLTEWPSAAQDLTEWQRIERENTEQYVLPFTYDYIAYPDVMVALNAAPSVPLALGNLGDKPSMGFSPSRFESDLPGLFSSRRFEGMLTNRIVNLSELIERSNHLEMWTVDIIGRLPEQR